MFELTRIFSEDNGIHSMTGAAHKSILYHKGEYIISEDISRHNTVDKAVGTALIKGFDFSECILFTSGRVPLDMIKKVAAAGIPVLISKSVPTVESVAYARKTGMTLICRAWKDSFEIWV